MGRFPSGQREQTVNLPLSASVVRIHPCPPSSAGMAELADAHDSGSCVRTYLQVQVLFPAPKPLIPQRFQGFSLCLEMSIDDDFPPWIAHDLADDFRRENMPKIKLKRVDGISRKLVSDAYSSFMRHCQLKNLSPYSYLYYEKNLKFFFDYLPQVKYVDDIDQLTIETFVGKLMDRGNRVTAINARLRAVHVFLRYCFEQEYAEPFPLSQIKEDEAGHACLLQIYLRHVQRQGRTCGHGFPQPHD